MGNWVLFITGTNFDQTVYNVRDLSILRGASLALEASVFELEYIWAKGKSLETLFGGGSQIAFRVDDKPKQEVKALAWDAHAYLSKVKKYGENWPPYPSLENLVEDLAIGQRIQHKINLEPPTEHMCFSVGYAEIDGSSADGLNSAIVDARNNARREQMRLPTLPRSLATWSQAGSSARASVGCPFDPMQQIAEDYHGVWVNEDRFPNAQILQSTQLLKEIATSKRSADLRTYGRDARRSLYSVQMRSDAYIKNLNRHLFDKFDFAENFHQLIEDPPAGLSKSAQGKLAYCYFDGNAMSDKAKPGNLGVIELSKRLSRMNEAVLDELVSLFLRRANDPLRRDEVTVDKRIHLREPGKPRREWKYEKRGLLRMETLLFGGEDFLLVLPGWLGWEVAWRLLDSYEANGVTDELTFRAGLLICDEKTPARRARDMAQALCGDAKQAFEGSTPQSALSIHVMESHDVPESGGDLAEDLVRLRGPLYQGSDGAGFRFLGSDRIAFEALITKLKASFARSQLVSIINDLDQLEEGKQEEALSGMLRSYALRGRGSLGVDEMTGLLKPPEGVSSSFWLKVIADTWDYVEPFKVTEIHEEQLENV